MPINLRRRLRHPISRGYQKILRGGLFIDILIHRILRQIAVSRNDSSLWPNEYPVILVVLLDPELPFMNQGVMARTKRHQIIDARFAAVRPMLYVMKMQEATIVTAGESAALTVLR